MRRDVARGRAAVRAALFRGTARAALVAAVCLAACRYTNLVVRGDYARVWRAGVAACDEAGYGLVDREHDGYHPERGLMELSHRIRFLQGEQAVLRVQHDHPREDIGREIRISVREVNTVAFVLTLGLSGNRRREGREIELARRIRQLLAEPTSSE